MVSCRAVRASYSGWMPASLTSSANRLIDVSTNFLNSTGVLPTGSIPIAARPSRTAGAVSALRISACSFVTITAGVFVPLDRDMIEQVIADNPQFLRKSLKALIDNRRFAEALYRTAVVSGTMQQVAYQDTMVHSS